MNFKLKAAAAAAAIACAPHVAAQTPVPADEPVPAPAVTPANKGQAQVAGRIAASFVTLAGSEANALALVNALRTGSDITLVTAAPPPVEGEPPPEPVETTFTPPTGKMGWGNVSHALALAQDSLTRAGITEPTAADLQAALLGGEVTNADGTVTSLEGILQMRADGMGWGEIANASGTRLGTVVSAIKSTHPKTVLLPPETPSSGITTASGTGATTLSHGNKAAPRGITTAAGAGGSGTTHGSKGGSRGITTAAGGTVSGVGAASADSGPKGNAYGRGVVTAAGGGAAFGASMASAHRAAGAGVTTAGGAAATGTAGAITTAQGHGQGATHGNAGGNGRGKGKGGG